MLFLSYKSTLNAWKREKSFVPILSLNCTTWAFLRQGVYSAGPVSNKVLTLKSFPQSWCTVHSTASFFFVTYCLFGNLSFSSPAFSEVSHRQKKWGKMKMETGLALMFSSSTFFSVNRGNLYNLVQNVDIFLNKCWQGWANFSKSVYSKDHFLGH